MLARLWKNFFISDSIIHGSQEHLPRICLIFVPNNGQQCLIEDDQRNKVADWKFLLLTRQALDLESSLYTASIDLSEVLSEAELSS
jgi:hypothetical protein